ncbi:MAG: type I restriction-modification system endonuclease [Lachnospiraceae bacterium]|nr:type I restriction-modification system endonuclease [Lachnospiraceae bacterium]
MGNFTFLKNYWEDLGNTGELAENYVYSDPNTSMIKQGMFAERLVKYMLAYDGIEEPDYDNTHANRIKLLKKQDLLPRDIDDTLYVIRKMRNDATHNGDDDLKRAKDNLRLTFNLGVWFMQTYGDYTYEPAQYIEPVDMMVRADILAKENSELEAKYAALEAEIETIRRNGKADSKRRATAYQKAVSVHLSEAQTRELIDEQLRRAGWDADTENIRYSKGSRPEKNTYKAIAEWPTDSSLGNKGYADYALFIGETLVAIVEAKKMDTDVFGALNVQAKDYAKNIRVQDQKYVLKKFGDYYVPFVYATNGRPYLEQYKEKSGIWGLDTREPFNIPTAVDAWPRPEEMILDLQKDVDEANKKLIATGYEELESSGGLNLRYYQIEAIKAAENAIINEHKKTVLLAMATGTGKTRTVLGMVYRFLTAKRFKRILYLVDRNALGEQTMDTFREVKLKDLLTLNQIYDVKELKDKEFDKDTKVHICTVQSLVKRVLYDDSDYRLGSTDYDLIIVDEAHRGYILDKDMAEEEMLYRDQDDYRSKYRSVIDYFDAIKIALTATPALQTTEIFGSPVYTYDYRTAVIDGYLVDHDAPHIIKTKLSEEGITFEAGSTVPIYDPVTKQILNSEKLDDDLKFEVDKFNKQVVTENFNRTVLTEIAKDIDPNERGKTLVFAVDDSHADMVTRILQEIYSEQGISSEAIMKITGSIENGNQKRINEVIRKFKNDTYPNIVVTVDLLTTGIDVEEIENLVFLRRIKSRILFEQMLGRATRLCDDIGKSHFEIYDAVGVYNALEPVTNMKPIVVNTKTTFEDLVDGFDALETQAQKKNQIDMIIAKIRRNLTGMSRDYKDQFAQITKFTPEQFVKEIRNLDTDKAEELIKTNRSAFQYIKRLPREHGKAISSEKDELRAHERGYGDATRPEDYLKEFRNFIDTHLNEIAALRIVATRPQDLTRQSLKELKLILDRNNFSETMLKTAWKDMTNEDIAADIISFIRQRSIGDVLISKDDRIHNAVAKVKKAHPELTKVQIGWLDRIESQLLKETILNRETFESAAFVNKGGYNVVNKAFGNKLDEFIAEINDAMYEAI